MTALTRLLAVPLFVIQYSITSKTRLEYTCAHRCIKHSET